MDAEFGRHLITQEVQRLTYVAELGWRIDGERLIGWRRKRRTYEDMIDMAHALTRIIAAFPDDIWQQAETRQP